jgi:hypothetical protein
LKNKDIALNNVLVFAPWFESGQGQEKQTALPEFDVSENAKSQ